MFQSSRSKRRRLPDVSPDVRYHVEMLEERLLLSAVLDLAIITNQELNDGSLGITLRGHINDISGKAVSSAGDVNGDGFVDVIIGAHLGSVDSVVTGKSYVWFGNRDNTLTQFNLQSMLRGDGSEGFAINGAQGFDFTGASVDSAGDVNGDGLVDLIIGAPGFNGANDRPGRAFVLFGDERGFGTQTNLVDLISGDGSKGFVIDGIDNSDYTGSSVRSAGDINGDGLDDLIIGGHGADSDQNRSGEAYVVLGRSSGFASHVDLGNLAPDGSEGFVIKGHTPDQRLGFSVDTAGDVNGDGLADLLIGGPGGRSGGLTTGDAYIVFGSRDGFDSELFVQDLVTSDGSRGVVLQGMRSNDETGYNVAAAGDFNGDGFDDILISAHAADVDQLRNIGLTYLVFGRSDFDSGRFKLSSLLTTEGGDGSGGAIIQGVSIDDHTGYGISSAGDFNGDGLDDLLIATPFASTVRSNAGEAYIVYGNRDGLGTRFDLSTLFTPEGDTSGMILLGLSANGMGRSLAAGGDINGDGFDDILLGAPFSSRNGNIAGETFVIFGSNTTNAATQIIDESLAINELVGTDQVDVLIGSADPDTLIGNGGADVLRGGAGDDVIRVTDLNFDRIHGGTGIDTLALDEGLDALNLVNLPLSRIDGIDAIDLRRTGPQSLSIDLDSLYQLADDSNTLRVFRDLTDQINFDANWIREGIRTERGQAFNSYVQGSGTLLIQRFGNALGGTLFDDRNGTGVFDQNEPPLAGWMLYLDDNRNEQLDLGEAVTLSNADGTYLFEDLEPGEYAIEVIPRQGWLQTKPAEGPLVVQVTEGELLTDLHIGHFLMGVIQGQIFNDRDSDGVNDDLDPGINDWTVELLDYRSGEVIAVTQSRYVDINSDGRFDEFTEAGTYRFDGLVNRSYLVRQTIKPGWRATSPLEPNEYQIDIRPGDQVTDAHFGNHRFPNVAFEKPATQSGTLSEAVASRAVDGNTDGDFADNSVTLTPAELEAWWEVDLESTHLIDGILVWGRADIGINLTEDFEVFVSALPFESQALDATRSQPEVLSFRFPGVAGRPTSIDVNAFGRYVRVQRVDEGVVSLAEVEVLGEQVDNAAPSATDDLLYTDRNIPLIVQPANLLANDTDPNSDPLTILQVTPLGSGSVVLNDDGSIRYTPDDRFAGTDRFQYTVSDGRGGSAIGLAEIAVGTINLAVGGTASQSSTLLTATADLANDGNRNGDFFADSVSSTSQESDPWWEIDLGLVTDIDTILIWNRSDAATDRLRDFDVFVSNEPFTSTDLTVTRRQFGVSRFRVVGEAARPTRVDIGRMGRYVRIQLDDLNYLSLAEVEILGPSSVLDVVNLSEGKPATQSTTILDARATLAVDGDTNGDFDLGSVTATNRQQHPWWEVDLESLNDIAFIDVWNRTDAAPERLADFDIFVSQRPFESGKLQATREQVGVVAFHVTGQAGSPTRVPIDFPGRYVRIQLTDRDFLSLAEVQVFGQPVDNLALNKSVIQSNDFFRFKADLAVDDNVDGDFDNGSVSSTNLSVNPFWEVDLFSRSDISFINLWNRTDTAMDRLSNVEVFVSNFPFESTDLQTTRDQAGVDRFVVDGEVGRPSRIEVNRQARYVRVQLEGTTYLSLAEVQVFGLTNLARFAKASQSSTADGGTADRAIDGGVDGVFANGSVTLTQLEPSPWWQMNLGQQVDISYLNIWNRFDALQDTLSNFDVFVSTSPFESTDIEVIRNDPSIGAYRLIGIAGQPSRVNINQVGQYIRIQLDIEAQLNIAEVQVYGELVPTAGNNVAIGKPTRQSSTFAATSGSSNAVDGDTNGDFNVGSVTATKLDTDAWWEVDLQEIHQIDFINIWNRTDAAPERLTNFEVLVSDVAFQSDDLAVIRNQAGVRSVFVSGTAGRPTRVPVNQTGRFVRVQLTDTQILSLAEVEVFGEPAANILVDLSRGKTTRQSSTATDGGGNRAVDGVTDGDPASGSVSATTREREPWWEVDLGEVRDITRIEIWNRTDAESERLRDFELFVSDDRFVSDALDDIRVQPNVSRYEIAGIAGRPTLIDIDRTGRYVRVQLTDRNILSLAEVRVLGPIGGDTL